MTLQLIPELQKKHPKHQIDYFCNSIIGQNLAGLMREAGVAEIIDTATFNSRSHEYTEAINLIGYPLADGYPEKPMTKHLLEYFGAEVGLNVKPNDMPKLHLMRRILFDGLPKRYATLHAQAGWSVYKNWSFRRWQEVLRLNPDIPVFQIGAETDFRIEGADHRFMGRDLEASIGLMSNASMHMGVDSWTNHLSHVHWMGKGQTPSIILWGSTQWQAAGYPHNINISLGLDCQPCFREDPRISRMSRGPCINPPGQVYEKPCHACMEGIGVEEVAEKVKTLWESVTSKP
jgi:ADP-heptose:LPS heptosyltransferase